VTAVRQYRTISQHPAYTELADRPFPAADWWTSSAVYLPFGMAMTPDDAVRVADAIRDAEVPLHELGSA
jgi:dTDP-4-amino-4,6-dideoxygalactose transaminase